MKKLLLTLLLLAPVCGFADSRIWLIDSTDKKKTTTSGIVVSGNQVTTSNSVALYAVSNLLNGSGLISTNLLPAASSSTVTGSTSFQVSDVAASTTYANLVTVTNTATSGTRFITARAFYSDDDSALGQNAAYARLLEVSLDRSTTNILQSCGFGSSGSAFYDAALPFPGVFRTATATNIYVLQGAADTSTQGSKFRNAGNSVATGTFAFTNACFISIQNF